MKLKNTKKQDNWFNTKPIKLKPMAKPKTIKNNSPDLLKAGIQLGVGMAALGIGLSVLGGGE